MSNNWLERLLPSLKKNIHSSADNNSQLKMPDGLWKKCKACQSLVYTPELERALNVCPKCGAHLRISAAARIQFFLDADSVEPIAEEVRTRDPLTFKAVSAYADQLKQAQTQCDSSEALVVAKGQLKGMDLVVAVFDFGFMGGSMGSVVGERFCRAVNTAINQACPLVCFSASGGARMQEGLLSLFQMAKTAQAVGRLREARLPYISVFTDPVYGGVSASLANLGDIIIAEPDTMVGFAGPRVIEQTVRERLPTHFQTSEFLLKRGVIDMICPRIKLRDKIARLLSMLMGGSAYDNFD